MFEILRLPWRDIVHAVGLMFPDRRERWIRARLEYAFGEPVGVSSVPDFDDADWIATEYAHILSAVEGPSSLRAAAHADVETALGRPVDRERSPIADVPIHCRSTDWSRLGQRLCVDLPPLDVPRLPAVVALVVAAGVALLVRKFVPREALDLRWKYFALVALPVVWLPARLFAVPPWHLRTEEQLVSHVVVERAGALPADHPWTLAEVADVAAAVTDLPPGRRPFSATELELLAIVTVTVGLAVAGVWRLARLH